MFSQASCYNNTMSTRYIDYHVENLRLSKFVNTSFTNSTQYRGRVQNKFGQYWGDLSFQIAGLHDVRPRTGTFANPWGAVSDAMYVLPTLEPVLDSLATLLDRRANELLSLSRPIAVMWSGGIDSTCVLAALIKNASEHNQIIVYHTNESIAENPEFYNKFIANRLQTGNADELEVTEEFLKTHILLHGDPGDCLYGPSMSMYKHLLPDAKHLLAWRSNRNLIIDGIVHRGAIHEFATWYVDKVSANISEAVGYDIVTIADWWWWHYFNLKWEFSIMRPFFISRAKTSRQCISASTVHDYVQNTFYNTDYFQNWSYTNLARLCYDPEQHKQQAKQYIFELDHNANYLNNKQKVVSILGNTATTPLYLGPDYRAYHYGDPGLAQAMILLLEQYAG